MAAEGAEVIMICAEIEAQIANGNDRRFAGIPGNDGTYPEPGVSKLSNLSYKLLNLLTYFTAGVRKKFAP